MATKKAKSKTAGNGRKTPTSKPAVSDEIKEIDGKIKATLDELSRLRDGAMILPLFLNRADITGKTVEDVFDDLRERFASTSKRERLDVILESGGGSIDPAYNIGLLLRRYATKELNIIIPRWAKSAATVIACAGDKLLLTPIAEIGPVDPQITMYNPLEERLEEFSPLDIDSTLDLIRTEFNEGNKDLAQGLLQRLQFPLTLGGIKKSLEVGTHYIERLLSSRMLRGDAERAKEIARCLVHDYSNHGFCIEIDEICTLGMKAEMLPDKQIDVVWNFRKLVQEKARIEKLKKQKEVEEMLKNLPPELLKQLPEMLRKNGTKESDKATPAETAPSKEEVL
jgi:hypothetical protein